MGRISLLVSRDEMLYQAHNIMQERKYPVDDMHVIDTEESVAKARECIASGSSVIIARGLQASLIKQYTDIPVVEIVITAQEMAILVTKAKKIVERERPVIAVVGSKNMFCDMSYFDNIYDIELRTYFADDAKGLETATERALNDKADLIIGGDTAVSMASAAGIPSLFLSTTEDSIRNAFGVAENMKYAMELEKKNNAQMEAVLGYSFSGVIRIDCKARITVVNKTMEDILETSAKRLIGRNIVNVFPEIDGQKLNEILKTGKDTRSYFIKYARTSFYAILAPISVEGGTDGAILSCYKVRQKNVDSESVLKKHRSGFAASGSFEDIVSKSAGMQEVVHLARLYAQSEQPVLITGETGTERRLIAQSIHNYSLRSEEPFIMTSCEGLSDEAQREAIFGEKGILKSIGSGTVLIEEVDRLSLANQYSLFHLIRYGFVKTSQINVRILASSKAPLALAMKKGEILEDLYYTLEGLTVNIPPLRSRPEDLEYMIDSFVSEYCEKYSRFHVLTSGAGKCLIKYPWRGNILQLESFLERLILAAEKRSIDEIAVNKLLSQLYPEYENDEQIQAKAYTGDMPDGRSIYNFNFPYSIKPEYSARASDIIETLKKYKGNRQNTAKELGISKATLWRHMKKYGIEIK